MLGNRRGSYSGQRTRNRGAAKTFASRTAAIRPGADAAEAGADPTSEVPLGRSTGLGWEAAGTIMLATAAPAASADATIALRTNRDLTFPPSFQRAPQPNASPRHSPRPGISVSACPQKSSVRVFSLDQIMVNASAGCKTGED